MDFENNILRRIKDSSSYIVIEEDSSIDSEMNSIAKPRKRRLDHLSWEEKIQRKKLKNRVAAQTSRDRKKAKFEQLEENFDKLMTQNESVLRECENLKLLNEKLRAENADLLRALRQPCSSCMQRPHQSRHVECDDHQSGSTESDNLLLQQGVVAHSAEALTSRCNYSSSTLLKILLVCLLYKTSSMNSIKTSTLVTSMNSPRVFSQISPLILMQWVKNLNCKIHLVNPRALEKWWGRQQSNWNPMEVVG